MFFFVGFPSDLALADEERYCSMILKDDRLYPNCYQKSLTELDCSRNENHNINLQICMTRYDKNLG